MNPDDRLHRLLDEAVENVEPGYGLDRIRARTGRPPRRGWAWAAGGAALAAAATVAVVVAVNSGAGTTGAEPGPAASGRSLAEPGRIVYFVGQTGAGPRLFPELHIVGSAGTALDEAVGDALSGRVDDLDYDTPWPVGASLQRAQLEAGVLSVDLSGPVVERSAGMTRATATLAVQQLVWTAQATSGTTKPVTFLVDGRPTPTVLGEPTDGPVRAAAADDVLAPVSVTSPAEGTVVDSPFTVQGRANAFEATVAWELMSGSRLVKQGSGMAHECCTMSPYSFKITAPPGEYTLVVHDEDVSDGEGNPQSQDTKRVTVR